MRLRKARKLGPKPGASANSCVNQPARFKNDVWTCDFIHDRTAGGRPLKWLTLVDEYTRECLVLHAATSITGADVRRIMARVIGRRGAPTRIRSDNGSEFICEALVNWLPGVGAKLDPGGRGEPLGERIHRIVSQSLARRVPGAGGIRDVADERRVVVPAGIQHGPASQLLGYATPKEFSESCDERRTANIIVKTIISLYLLKELPFQVDQKMGSRPRGFSMMVSPTLIHCHRSAHHGPDQNARSTPDRSKLCVTARGRGFST